MAHMNVQLDFLHEANQKLERLLEVERARSQEKERRVAELEQKNSAICSELRTIDDLAGQLEEDRRSALSRAGELCSMVGTAGSQSWRWPGRSGAVEGLCVVWLEWGSRGALSVVWLEWGSRGALSVVWLEWGSRGALSVVWLEWGSRGALSVVWLEWGSRGALSVVWLELVSLASRSCGEGTIAQ